MATICVAVLAVVLLHVATLHAVPLHPVKYDPPERANNPEFYDVVRQLLELNSGFLQEQTTDETATEPDSVTKPDIPKVVKNWPQVELKVGQIAGIAVNAASQPVIFHRADRVFDEHAFNATNHYQHFNLGPIPVSTVLTLHPTTGLIIGAWGDDLFYMPHGITIDHYDNLWVTDVALHQAFKFKPGELEPTLSFGQAFQPGSGVRHLCMPTAIAVASTGEIFIADGYCNSRILKFNAAGGLLRIIPNPPEFLSLQVPHGLALIESLDRLCIADRENMRVTCPRAGLYSTIEKREPALTIQQPDMGRVFGVASKGKYIYAINGPTSSLLPVQGLTIDPEAETVIDHWAPEEGFKRPHAIAICPRTSALYISEIGPNRVWKFELVSPKK